MLVADARRSPSSRSRSSLVAGSSLSSRSASPRATTATPARSPQAAVETHHDRRRPPRRTTRPSDSTTPTTLPSGPAPTTPAPVGTCGDQTEAIVAAIEGSEGPATAPAGPVHGAGAAGSRASAPIWAAAEIVPKPGVQLDRATVVLQRIGALWNVRTSARRDVRRAARARAELNLTCSGTPFDPLWRRSTGMIPALRRQNEQW